MARIPDASALGTVIPIRNKQVIEDRSGQIRAEGLQNLAQGIQSVGNAAYQVQKKEDQFSYARAKTAMLNADIEMRKSLENDDDFGTFEQRYAEGMTKARESAFGLIRSGNDRKLFELEAETDVLRGTEAIRQLAKRKEVDWGRSTVDQDLEDIRRNAITADEATRQKYLDSAKELIVGGEQRGYYSKQEATNLFQQWRDSAVAGYIESQPPEKQVEILTGTGNVSDYLQPDVKAKMLEQAKNARRDVVVRGESQRQADAIVAKYAGNWKAAIAEARKITDPEVRDATESRIKQDWQMAEKLEGDYRESLLEQATAFVVDGGKYADLPSHIKNGLKPSTLNSLRNFAEQGAKVQQTDPELIMEISNALGEGYQKFGEMDTSDWRFRMTAGDFEQYSMLHAKVRAGNLDGKDTGFRTTAQLRNQVVNELFKGNDAKTTKKKGQFINDFEARLQAFQADKGKKASSDEVKKILDDMTVEVGLSWARDKMAYELTDEDISTGGRSPIVVPKSDRDQIISALRSRNIEVTEDNILRMYRSAK